MPDTTINDCSGVVVGSIVFSAVYFIVPCRAWVVYYWCGCQSSFSSSDIVLAGMVNILSMQRSLRSKVLLTNPLSEVRAVGHQAITFQNGSSGALSKYKYEVIKNRIFLNFSCSIIYSPIRSVHLHWFPVSWSELFGVYPQHKVFRQPGHWQ
jgi:hypothetical protein